MFGKVRTRKRYITQKNARIKLERKIVFSFFVYDSRNTEAPIPISPTKGWRSEYSIFWKAEELEKIIVLISVKNV